MQISQLSIEGAFEITPRRHSDARGEFLEWCRGDLLAQAVGHPLRWPQSNMSVSARGVVRGVHFTDVPPGQAKHVTCAQGAVWDVVVDLRVASPTFGAHEAVRLDDVDRRVVYLAEGLGHAFCALTNGATVVYQCSETYAPEHDQVVHPLDPVLGIAWPTPEPLLSARDAGAPTLAQARLAGRLPEYPQCRRRYRELARRAGPARVSGV